MLLRLLQITTLMLGIHASTSFACSVTRDYEHPTIPQRVVGASYVVVGGAEEIKDELSKRYGRGARVTVEKWLKGNGLSQIVVYKFGWGPDCLAPVPTARSIFFLKKLDQSQYILHYGGVQDAVIAATDENMSEVIEALKTKEEGLGSRHQ